MGGYLVIPTDHGNGAGGGVPEETGSIDEVIEARGRAR